MSGLGKKLTSSVSAFIGKKPTAENFRADPTNHEFQDHVLDHFSLSLTALLKNQWIAESTLNLILDTFDSHRLPLNLDAAVTRSGQSHSRAPSGSSALPKRTGDSAIAGAGASAGAGAPPPLPSRQPTSAAKSPNLDDRINNVSSAIGRTAGAAAGAAVSESVTVGLNERMGHLGIKGAGQYTAGVGKFVGSQVGAATSASVSQSVSSNVNSQINSLGLRKTASSAPQKRLAIAISDFETTETGDLPFRVGDFITIVEDVDDNWYRGELRGKTGIFPKSFVELRS
ncbi:uncharacterized protein BJ171DRAFT_208048 [Polychytrium aggregatum]|uniref:uncharacterized protein n=1 Tax=Polychytrium aggregatum TaxID=110093 RepID=UPI0022FEB989|nr:uncharacterized protein BJ171DRAFT_208048 [Polychytrium aggregatum]KAI9208471.1 hypothetical protein BJ171DRAFT_208048 [Polychytrium aggregatum]